MFEKDAAAFIAKRRSPAGFNFGLDSHATLGTAYAELVTDLCLVPTRHNGHDIYTLTLIVHAGENMARCEGKVTFQPVADGVRVPGTSPVVEVKLSRAASGRLTTDQAVERVIEAMREQAGELLRGDGSSNLFCPWFHLERALGDAWGDWVDCPDVEKA